MPVLGAPELIIILVIIILIFGAGKLGEVGSALGRGIREFRTAANVDDNKDEAKDQPTEKPAAVEAPRPATAIEAPRQPVASPAASSPVAYTVESGDTIEKVAERHGVTVQALLQANGWSTPDRQLYPGDRIQIPRAPTSAA